MKSYPRSSIFILIEKETIAKYVLHNILSQRTFYE